MSHWKAKVDQQPIAQVLGNIAIVSLDDIGTNPLIRTDHVTPVFWVELAGESSGVHQITKHHSELPSFRVRRRGNRARCNLRGWLFLSSRLLYRLSRWS